jgi:DeoR family deoxyribose operon repressor
LGGHGAEESWVLLPRRQDRLERLGAAIAARGVLHLREAAALLAVSEMTVRRDIAACGGRFAYLGGYIVGQQDDAGVLRPYVFAREAETNAQGKREACTRAAALIEPDDTVFLDCGTTLPELAARLPAAGARTVVCYAMNIAEIVCKQPNLTVMLLGGLYQPASESFSASPESLDMLERVGITKAFISAGGVHLRRGVSCSNFHEVPIKQKALQVSLKRYLVVDSSKFDVVRAAFFAPLAAFDAVITDAAVPPAERAAFEAAGVPLLVAGAPAAAPVCG